MCLLCLPPQVHEDLRQELLRQFDRRIEEITVDYIRVKCVNEDCPVKDHAVTIPAGRPVAPGVTEKLGHLTCDTCGHDMWKEPVK